MNKIDINEIFENVKKDTSLLSTINIDELLKAVENEQNNYLENKTLDHLFNENMKSLHKLKLSPQKVKEICEKLIEYRFVENLSEIHKGKHIRWIKINDINTKLTNGGLVMDIKFFDNGSYILCKNMQHRLFQIKFDDCILFQKLSQGEQLILLTQEHIHKK
jgi:hypothetical protein